MLYANFFPLFHVSENSGGKGTLNLFGLDSQKRPTKTGHVYALVNNPNF